MTRFQAAIPAAILVLSAFAACGQDRDGGTSPASSDTPPAAPTPASSDTPPAAPTPAGVAVVAGSDSVALLNASGVTEVEGFDADDPALYESPAAVGVDGAVAVLANGMLVTVEPTGAVRDSAPCEGCAGLARTPDDRLVTTRSNLEPGDGFDIVVFNSDLESAEPVPARRVEERVTTSAAPENDGTPVTVAAGDGDVVVTYLSLNGGTRRGPSVVARYGLDATLMGDTLVDGVVYSASASPDGGHLALGVGGSGGACITSSELRVLQLPDLTELRTSPTVPSDVQTRPSLPEDTWFLARDLNWHGHRVLVSGEVHISPSAEDIQRHFDETGEFLSNCDEDPDEWRRSYDVSTQSFDDLRAEGETTDRWIGPGCDDVVRIDAAALEATVGFLPRVLYSPARTADC